MGDCALVIFYDKPTTSNPRKVSPTIYLHWHGYEVPPLLEKLKQLMLIDRPGDVDYSAARFAGICHDTIKGSTGLGLWATPQSVIDAVLVATDEKAPQEEIVAAKIELDGYSHGDAGVVIVNTEDFTWQAYGGYLKDHDKEDAA